MLVASTIPTSEADRRRVVRSRSPDGGTPPDGDGEAGPADGAGTSRRRGSPERLQCLLSSRPVVRVIEAGIEAAREQNAGTPVISSPTGPQAQQDGDVLASSPSTGAVTWSNGAVGASRSATPGAGAVGQVLTSQPQFTTARRPRRLGPRVERRGGGVGRAGRWRARGGERDGDHARAVTSGASDTYDSVPSIAENPYAGLAARGECGGDGAVRRPA